MRRYKILHQTIYDFSEKVQLGPHTLRLRPREGHELRIESSALDITPSAVLRWQRDAEGNSLATATFADKAARLVIQSETIIQQYDQAPHDFIVSDYAVEYPFSYQEEDKILLLPYMRHPMSAANNLFVEWVGQLWSNTGKIQTFSLLLQLNQRIYQAVNYRLRQEAGVQTPEQTLSLGSGSCRDSAYLFMAAAQQLGFAARFVSGYIYTHSSNVLSGSTHAWAEVFIPGAGWKGFDPTIGTIVGAEHIAVSVARLPEAVPPVAGSFLGVAGATMTVYVWVSELR